MKRPARRRYLIGVLAVLSCQRLVGIHGTVPSSDGGGNDGAADAAVDARTGDAMSGRLTADAAGAGTADGGGAESGAANSPDATGVGPDGARGDAGGDASGDASGCGQLWHNENIQARVFNIPAGTSTACGFTSVTAPALAAGLNMADFRGAMACGGCLRVQPTFGANSVVVLVVDLAGAGMLLSQPAMDQIVPPGTGVVNVDWQLVPCETNGQPLRYFFEDGSNASFISIQMRNQRYPTARMVGVGSRGQTVALILQPHNFWQSADLGPGPLTLQLTDINGQTIEDSGIVVSPLMESVGQRQFPLCPP